MTAYILHAPLVGIGTTDNQLILAGFSRQRQTWWVHTKDTKAARSDVVWQNLFLALSGGVCMTRILLFLVIVIASTCVAQSAKERDVRQRMQETLDAWETLDPDKAEPFYAKDRDLVFYDLAPLKATGWEEYEKNVREMLGEMKSLELNLDDVRTKEIGRNFVLGTGIVHASLEPKQGAQEKMDARWTVLWEQRRRDWLIVHEHLSAPLPPPQAQAAAGSPAQIPGLNCTPVTLVNYRPGPNFSRMSEHGAKHVEFVREHSRAGHIVQAGPFSDRTGAMVIVKQTDLREVDEMVRQDPYVSERVMTYTLQPWQQCTAAQ
jgi:uncharacterized protein YciI/ketosteroid isomerase-like protein